MTTSGGSTFSLQLVFYLLIIMNLMFYVCMRDFYGIISDSSLVDAFDHFRWGLLNVSPGWMSSVILLLWELGVRQGQYGQLLYIWDQPTEEPCRICAVMKPKQCVIPAAGRPAALHKTSALATTTQRLPTGHKACNCALSIPRGNRAALWRQSRGHRAALPCTCSPERLAYTTSCRPTFIGLYMFFTPQGHRLALQ